MIGYAQQLILGREKKPAVSIPSSLFWVAEGTLGIQGLPFDLFISEEHSLEFKISDHPLQDGNTVSDHVTQELRSVSIDGLFTNHPMRYKDDEVEVSIDGAGGTAAELSNVALQKYLALEDLAKRREPVQLVTSLVNYPEMIITSVKASRNEKSGESIRFSMTLREVQTVTLRQISDIYVFSPSDMENANNRMIASKAKSGKRTAEEKEANELQKLLDIEVIQ